MTVSINPKAVKPTVGPASSVLLSATETVKDRLDSLDRVGTSGQSLARLDAPNVWDAAQTFSVPPVFGDPAGTTAALGILGRSNVFEAANQTIQYTDAGALGPILILKHATSSPAVSDIVGIINFNGRDSNLSAQDYADIRAVVVSPTAAAESGQLQFTTTISGTSANRMTLRNGLSMQGATSGDMGAGTINAVAVYDDGAGPLTDYVFDMHLTGQLSPDDADNAKAQAFDPALLDLDEFARRWTERHALPAMPLRAEWSDETRLPMGELVQRLWETVEVQAIHIEKLNARLKALEAK